MCRAFEVRVSATLTGHDQLFRKEYAYFSISELDRHSKQGTGALDI